MHKDKSSLLWTTALISLLHLPLLADPGFGTLRKKTVDLEVRQPAVVRLANTSIAFTGKSANPEYQPVLQSLLSTLETEIVAQEKTLVKKQNPKDAEWALYLDVTGYAAPPVQQNVQRSGNTTTTTYRWTGSLNVAYQVLDAGGRVHDASNVTENYDQTFAQDATRGSTSFLGIPGIGAKASRAEPIPQNPEDVKQILVHRAVRKIGSSLGNSSYTITVRVAGGENHLNRAGDFMAQRLWSRALDEIQGMSALPKPQDESYRLYSLGLIHEAMSYEAKNYKDQRANMMLAQQHYDKALETNRDEKYFVETVARLRDSYARYRALDQQQAEDRKNAVSTRARVETVSATPAPAPPKAEPVAAAPKAKSNTAAEIIKLHQAGIEKEQILEIVRGTPLEFNPVDIPTVIAIKQANLPVEIQNEMRKKVGADLLPVSAAPKPAVRKPAAPKPVVPKPAVAPAK